MVQPYRKPLNPNVLANKRVMDYKKKAAKEVEKKLNQPVPEIDEKGEYYALKYDNDHGRLVDKYKKNRFEELQKKYGKY